MSETLREPWHGFLHELDSLLTTSTDLHCLSGFVIGELYDLTRTTADLDVISVTGTSLATLQKLAGRDTPLHKRHQVYLDIVTVATVPDHYEERLLEWAPGEFQHLHLKVMERHDLVLAKLARNLDRDREDVRRLATGPGLDGRLMKRRYQSELRHQLSRPERDDLTLDLWLGMIQEVRGSRPVTHPT